MQQIDSVAHIFVNFTKAENILSLEKYENCNYMSFLLIPKSSEV